MHHIKGGSNIRIMVFSLGPIFNGQVHGGSQKALKDISIGLGEIKDTTIDIYYKLIEELQITNSNKNLTEEEKIKIKKYI